MKEKRKGRVFLLFSEAREKEKRKKYFSLTIKIGNRYVFFFFGIIIYQVSQHDQWRGAVLGLHATSAFQKEDNLHRPWAPQASGATSSVGLMATWHMGPCSTYSGRRVSVVAFGWWAPSIFKSNIFSATFLLSLHLHIWFLFFKNIQLNE